MMKPKCVFPDDVLEALRAKRKIEAIKLLRQAQNLELKEAKIAIDDYIEKHSDLFTEGEIREETGFRSLVVVSGIGLILYMVYRYLV